MTLNLLHLRYFYDTIRLSSVSQAAKANCVTQSAVSQGIMKLEKSLNTELLTHCRNKIKITSEGERFFHSCQQVMKSVSELEDSLQKTEKEYYGKITFACSHSIAQSVLEEVLFEFKQQAPHVYIKILLGHTGIIKEWIKHGRIEFGLILDNDDLKGLSCQTIYSGEFKIFQSVKRIDETPKECLFPEPRAEIFTIKNYYYNKYNRELKTALEINSWEVIANLVEKDVGCGFFPDYLALHPKRKALIQPCNLGLPPIPYNLMVALPKREVLSKNGLLFVDLLNKKMRKI